MNRRHLFGLIPLPLLGLLPRRPMEREGGDTSHGWRPYEPLRIRGGDRLLGRVECNADKGEEVLVRLLNSPLAGRLHAGGVVTEDVGADQRLLLRDGLWYPAPCACPDGLSHVYHYRPKPQPLICGVCGGEAISLAEFEAFHAGAAGEPADDEREHGPGCPYDCARCRAFKREGFRLR